jgi:hypothetical protein
LLREERRDASKLYNPMRIDELSTLDPSTPWLEYINRYTIYMYSMASVAVGISCTGPLGGKQGYLPYSIAVSLNSASVYPWVTSK